MLRTAYAIISLGVAGARFAGGTEIRVGDVTAPVFFRRALALAPLFPGRSSLSVSGDTPAGGSPPRCRLPHMGRDLYHLLALRRRVPLLQRLGCPQVQELPARDRDGRQQGLAHQVMGKREARLLAVCTGHKQAQALGLLERDQE